MKDKILSKVEESFIKAENFYKKDFIRPDNYIWNTKGSNAGHSNFIKRELMFNLTLASENEEEFIYQTVPHEVAHFVQRQLYPHSSHHGREWKFIMKYAMNLEAIRCHTYDVSSVVRQHQKFEYKCFCVGEVHKVGVKVHKKILQGINYTCNKCKARLIPTENLPKTDNEIKAQKLINQLNQLNQLR